MSTNNPRIEQTFSKLKTVCLGRFLIDVPEQAVVIYGPSETPWPITTYIGQAKEIDAFIAARLREVEDEKRFASGALRENGSVVGTVIEGIAPGQKIVFGVSKGSSRIYRVDSYMTSEDNLFVQRANPIPAERNQAVQKLNSIAAALRARDQLSIPTQPGLCIDGGFIANNDALSHETLKLGVRLLTLPDVHFSISVTKKDAVVESDALEPRLRQAEEIARQAGQGNWYSRIKTLRRGRRQIEHWMGFEMLARKPDQVAEKSSHEFVFVSQGEPNNALLPVLELELHTGVSANRVGAVKPSVTDDEAIVVWDKLTSSIRVRPHI